MRALILYSLIILSPWGWAEGLRPVFKEKISHTADDLLEVSLEFLPATALSQAEVLYKTEGAVEWVTLQPVFNETSVSAILPNDARTYLYHLLLPAGQALRYPESGVLHVPQDLEQEKRVMPQGGRAPDARWIYKKVGEKELFMDVFFPEGYAESKEEFPVMLIFHGGSWQEGETSWHFPDCAYWASRGMIAASVDYRLGKRDGIKNVPLECMKDAQSSVRFLKTEAERLKVDATRIVAAGGSAGAQLAASLGSITGAETAHVDDDLSVSAVPVATVLWNPYFKCEYDPSDYVRSGLPPSIAFLGDQDPAIPTAAILDYHQKLKAAGNVSQYYIGRGGKHGFCNGRNARNPFFYWSVEKIDSFLVTQGIISGKATLSIPEGVPVLKLGEDYAVHR